MHNKRYPWNDVAPGDSFFVPALDVERVRSEGIVEGIRCAVKVKAEIGVYNKRYGVLFTRLGKGARI